MAHDLEVAEVDNGENIGPIGEIWHVVEEDTDAGDVPEVMQTRQLVVERPLLVKEESRSTEGGLADEEVADGVKVEAEMGEKDHDTCHSNQCGKTEENAEHAHDQRDVAEPKCLVESRNAVVIDLLKVDVCTSNSEEGSEAEGIDGVVPFWSVSIDVEPAKANSKENENRRWDNGVPEMGILRKGGTVLLGVRTLRRGLLGLDVSALALLQNWVLKRICRLL